MNVIAYSSPFVPHEWITAHRLQPKPLCLQPLDGGTLSAIGRGNCPYVATLIETAIAGVDAAALVLTTVCDQMRYAAALLEQRSAIPVFLLNVPSTWHDASRQLYVDELRRLGRFLVSHGGRAPSDAELVETINSAVAKRRMPAAAPTSFEMADRPSAAVRLALLGGPLMKSDSALTTIVSQAGGQIVLDATEGGERTMPRPLDAQRIAADPVRALADAYFDIPDPFRRPNTRFYQWLTDELAARQVRGIILRRYLWCDIWHAEAQPLKQRTGLPLLEIDVGPDDFSSPNRVQGRIEAFLETLKAARYAPT